MTTQSVHDVLSAISVAKDALDAKPALESKIAELEAKLASAERHNQSLELSIIDYKSEIDAKRQTIDGLETAKANAERTITEMEDRQKAVSRFLGSLVGDASTLNDVLNPPAPVVAEPVPVEPLAPAEPASMDRGSEATPLGTSEVGQSSPAENQSPPPSLGRYHGKLYYFQPRWISRDAWLNEGGTNYSYDWRPNVNVFMAHKEQVPYGFTAEVAEPLTFGGSTTLPPISIHRQTGGRYATAQKGIHRRRGLCRIYRPRFHPNRQRWPRHYSNNLHRR